MSEDDFKKWDRHALQQLLASDEDRGARLARMDAEYAAYRKEKEEEIETLKLAHADYVQALSDEAKAAAAVLTEKLQAAEATALSLRDALREQNDSHQQAMDELKKAHADFLVREAKKRELDAKIAEIEKLKKELG